MNSFKVSVVIPIYDNSDSIAELCNRMHSTLISIHKCSIVEFILVNDGSKDNSWDTLQNIQISSPNITKIINFSNNFGQILAITAGINNASGDCVIVISADLQDPPELSSILFNNWLLGEKFVVASRINRSDGFFSDLFSNYFWSMLRLLVFPMLPKGGFDYFLIDKVIIKLFCEFPERNLFLQGKLMSFGFLPKAIPYVRQKRRYGKSRTKLVQKIKYFIDAFVGFSFLPLRILSIFGIFIFILSLVYLSYIVFTTLKFGSKVDGWSSIMVLILFFNGIQILGIGVIGEYLWRTESNSKKRPPYVIRDFVIKKNI